MVIQLLRDFFEASRSWLASQPDMNPWDEGCQRLARQLSSWVESYSEPICEAPVTWESPRQVHYLPRLWQCLSYHWEQACEKTPQRPIGVASVVARLREGRGWLRGGNLGGDPMRDMILAVAMTLRDGRAPRVFESDYYGFAKGLANRIDRRLSHDPDTWWTELLDYLAGYSEPPGRLERFHGKCALRNWLGTVLWNYLRRRTRRDFTVLTDEEVGIQADSTSAADDDAVQRESIVVFAKIAQAAFRRLSVSDRLLLSQVYLDGLKQKDVAYLLRVNPGTVTRRLDDARDRLRQELESASAAQCGRASFQDLVEEMAEGHRTFAEVFCSVLERTRRDAP